MKTKYVLLILLLALLISLLPVNASALAIPAPPVDMFQWPWEQGLTWVAFDGFDNGSKRASNSPHNYKMGGAIDFAPQTNMTVGMDTSNFWVTAAAAGTVFEKSSCHLKIDHGNGWTTEYWHLANLQVNLGSAVSRNQRLGVIADNKTYQVCTGNEFPGPHLHFVMRPDMKATIFSGWQINFNIFTNVTTFTKNGLTVGRLQPVLNIPNLQIAARGPLTWDTLYTGTVDPYRHERWTLALTEQTNFDITVNPTISGLVPAIVLLDSNGNEITRANGILTTTQPAGNYYVQIQSDLGLGFYNIIATRDGSTGATATPTPTGTSVATETPVFTDTPTVTETPIFTNTPIATETPTATGTLIATETSVVTATSIVTATPIVTATFGTPPVLTVTATATPIATGTPISTSTALPTDPYVRAIATPQSLILGETGLVTVSLNNVPALGYKSAEFVCTYNPVLVQISNITIAGLFGANSVSTLNDPQNGSFIIAIAGSGSNKAVTSGTVFTFNARGLQIGQTPVECTARVSMGDNTLESILSIPDILTILTNVPTATSMPAPLLVGQVVASKLVTIRLFNADASLAATTTANVDGTFLLTAPAGTYTIVASSDGFLNAQGSVTLLDGVVITMPLVTLPAGDIDGNGVIDQYDALTVGMSYNTPTPSTADLNNDGIINILDLELLAANYRKSGALVW